MLESVDRLIMKRLSLRPYRRWRQQFLKLRAAQRTPTHWGLEPHCPLAPLLPRIETEDTALVVGTGAAPTTYLLAAHDAAVTFIAGDLGCVERVESRMAAEALVQPLRELRDPASTRPAGVPELARGIRHRGDRSEHAARSARSGTSRSGAGSPAPQPARRGARDPSQLPCAGPGRSCDDVPGMEQGRAQTPAATADKRHVEGLILCKPMCLARHAFSPASLSPSDTQIPEGSPNSLTID